MLATQRHALILARLQHDGAVRVSDLTAALDVSDMTVRRDLEALAGRGLLEKVHGGAVALDRRSADEPGFATKSARAQAEKSAIARRAAERVTPGASVALSGGTTTWTLAHLLVDVPALTVVTNSVAVADVLHAAGRPDQTVVLTGGVRTPSDALIGPVAVGALRHLHVDLLFMGVHGMDAHHGFTTPNLLEAETNRALMASARSTVVLADHTKWGVVGLSSIADLADADVVISDAGLDARARTVLRKATRELVVAPAARAHTGAG